MRCVACGEKSHINGGNTVDHVATQNQCKDCKWFEMSREGDGAPGYGSCNMAWAWEVELPRAMFADGGGIVYVLPTHGCNAWEAKGQRE